MGKVRVATLGDEEKEKKRAEKAKARKEAKAIVEKKEEKRKESVIASEAKQSLSDQIATSQAPDDKTQQSQKQKKEKFLQDQKATHSARYEKIAKRVDKTNVYPLTDAIELLLQLDHAKFDETVELHINTMETGVSGSITLPHGRGKSIKVAIADDQLINDVASGKITFDVLLAEPSMMPKLARVAKVLGPRGLMPNPKNGTITQDPKVAAKKYEGGLMNYKTEAKAPILHLTVGKISFGKEKLSDNITAMIAMVKKSNIKNVTLKSTMSPGIKVQV